MENNHTPATEDITALAHKIWEEEGKPEGKAEEHWLRAEKELSQRSQTQVPADT